MGETCLSVLQQIQAAVTVMSDDDTNTMTVYIAHGEMGQTQSEELLKLLMSVMLWLDSSSNQECVDAFFPFMCQYLFPLCNTSGDLLLPSQEECLAISTGVCQVEWDLLSRVAADYLPICADLPQGTSINTSKYLIRN